MSLNPALRVWAGERRGSSQDACVLRCWAAVGLPSLSPHLPATPNAGPRPLLHPQLCHFVAMRPEEAPVISLSLTFHITQGGSEQSPACLLKAVSASTQELSTPPYLDWALGPLGQTGSCPLGQGAPLLWVPPHTQAVRLSQPVAPEPSWRLLLPAWAAGGLFMH